MAHPECECPGCHSSGESEESLAGQELDEAPEEYEEEEETSVSFEDYQAADEGEAEWSGEAGETGEAADRMLETGAEVVTEVNDLYENVGEADETDGLGESSPELEGEVVVSGGEYGAALAWLARAVSLPDAVPWLLKQSPTFKAVVKTLDAKYFYLSRPSGIPDDWPDKFAPDANGVFTKGPQVGRRMLEIRPSTEGSFFRPVTSPEGLFAADVIHLEPPAGRSGLDERGAWVETIVHESVHAQRHVLGKRRVGATAAARIRSGIDDEIATRQVEGQVVGELRQKFPQFAAYQPTTGRLEPWAVERDFITGPLRLGYLEHFVLEERLADSRRKLMAAFTPSKRASTAEAEVALFDQFVDKIVLAKRPLDSYLAASPEFIHPVRGTPAVFQPEYPKLRLIRRVIDARVRSLTGLSGRDPHRDPDLEKMRQAHAQAFFAGLGSYTPVPARP